MSQNEIGARIARLRKALGYKQNNFAEMLRVSASHINRVEKGKVRASDQLISAISEKTKYRFEWIRDGIEPEIDLRQNVDFSKLPNDNFLNFISEKYGEYDQKSETLRLIGKTTEILRSNTVYRTALTSNINAFHKAIIDEQQSLIMEKRIEVLEKKLSQLNGVNERIDKLSRQCLVSESLKKSTG